MGRAKDTAELTAFARAAGAHEPVDHVLHNPDGMAREFLGWQLGIFADLCSVSPLRRVIDRIYEGIAPGAARYLLARTKHFDRLLLEELEDGATQVVLLGAGYDSRPYRFEERLKKVRVFEVDHPDTARRKIAMLIDKRGAVPSHVRYVTVDFGKESVEQRLIASGFDPSARAFFLWEGVTYYLEAAAVDEVFATIMRASGPRSSVAFDYVYRSAIEGSSNVYGAREIRRGVRRLGEPMIFGFPDGGARDFLEARGFTVLSDLTAEELDRRYLTGPDGQRHGKVSGFFAIAHGRVAAKE